MRIVHIFPCLTSGGAERVLAHIMTHLDRSRFDVSGICLAGRTGSELEDVLDRAQIPIQYLGKGSGFDGRMFSRVHRAIRAARPDVLHSHVHVLRYVLPYIAYSRLAGNRLRLLHTVHNLAEFEVEPRARWIQRLSFRAGALPVAVAEEVSDSLTRLYGLPRSPVVANCVPVERYRRPHVGRAAWRQAEEIPQDALLVTCVAGLRPQKNPPQLLAAFRTAAAHTPHAHLLLAGGGDQKRLRELARVLGITERVHFLGVRRDIPDILAASDLFALASQYEGNPMCIMEAMSAGLPVVAPRVGGIPELVNDGAEGFLTAPGDAQSLAAAMRSLIEDADLRCRFGSACAERADRQFDVRHMVAGYQRLYEELGSSCSGQPRPSSSHAGVAFL